MSDMMQIGQTLLGYEVIDLLVSGGQADLAKARDPNTGALFVIKKLLPGTGSSNVAAAIERFRRAAELRIGHPLIVDPIQFSQEGNDYYAVFPYADGVDLDAYVARQQGGLPVAQAVSIVVQLCEALAAAHAQGIVHRDVKPANILILPDNSIRLIDFGICRITSQQTISQSAGILGTMYWLPPEQLHEPWKSDPRADIYAVGAVLYFLLTGIPPFSATDTATGIDQIKRGCPRPPHEVNANVPVALSQVCLKLVAKDPAARFQSCQEVIQVLKGGAQPAPTGAHCASCFATLPQGAKFCQRCGASQTGQASTKVRCLACGNPVGAEAQCPSCGRPYSPSNHRFRFTGGLFVGVELRVPEGIYLVGRDQFSPGDHSVSRQQLFTACINGTVILQDAGATNKTRVAGQIAASPVVIQSNQELQIGNHIATYISN